MTISAVHLFDEVIALGLEYDAHESDLYLRHTPAAVALLDRYAYRRQVRAFVSGGNLWFEVPFAYAPFWRRRLRA